MMVMVMYCTLFGVLDAYRLDGIWPSWSFYDGLWWMNDDSFASFLWPVRGRVVDVVDFVD